MLLDRARQSQADGDLKASVIDLKALLSAQPGNAEARFLLGRLYLETGNPQGAIKELERARELGVTEPALALGLTRALLLTGQFDDAATEIAINGDTAKPDWLVLRGMLDLGQQRIDDARSAFRQVLEDDPDNESARRGLMQAELAAGNGELARAEVQRLLEMKDADASLWMIKGELDLYDGNAEAARDAFRRAVELEPSNPVARIGLARALIELDAIEEAAAQLDKTGRDGAEDPRVNFLRAMIAEKREDFNAALQALRKVLQIAPMHRESLITAAKLHFARGEFTRAQDYVGRLLEIEPNNAAAQRMMGAIQLAAGRVDGLDAVAEAAADERFQDPAMLAMLGTAYLKHGKFDDSQASLERAAELAPDSLPIRTQLALSRLSAGEPDRAIAELEAVLAEDPGFAQADIMLALVHLSRDDKDSALAAADALVAKQPDNALAHNVRGYVLELAEKPAQAVAEYELALEKDPKFHPARINLARIAIRDKDIDTGRKRFQEVLEFEPFHAFALMGLAALALQEDNVDEAERLWLLAREQNPDAVAPRLLLARHYRTKGNRTLAEATIKEAYKLAPYAPQVQAEYAAIMLDAGQFDEALSAAQQLVERTPKSLPGLELLARIYNQLGDEAGLTDTLQRIAEIAPDAVGARLLLGRLAIRNKDFEQAGNIASALRADDKHAAAGHELEGDILNAQGNSEAAREAWLRAFALAPATATVIKLNGVEQTLGIEGDRLGDWLEEHPDDLRVRLVRASFLQQEGSGAAAIPEYERMLKEQGANPIVLNNLAWLYHEAGDERASELARRAYELAPKSPEIMDTYGWILYQQGQREQGMDLMNKALAAAPDNPDIAYHIALARHDAGQSAAARDQLEKILAKHAQFALREDAEALLAKISGE